MSSLPEFETLLYEKFDDTIVRITMNRPETRNAQNWLMTYELNDAFDAANGDNDVKLIILAGAGPHFSAGHDLKGSGSKLDAFILLGGWAQFATQAYAQVTDQVMAKLKAKDLIIVAGDTLPPQMEALKAGRSHGQIGQRPFEMGYKAPSVMIELIEGKKVADPVFTGLDECTADNAATCVAK